MQSFETGWEVHLSKVLIEVTSENQVLQRLWQRPGLFLSKELQSHKNSSFPETCSTLQNSLKDFEHTYVVYMTCKYNTSKVFKSALLCAPWVGSKQQYHLKGIWHKWNARVFEAVQISLKCLDFSIVNVHAFRHIARHWQEARVHILHAPSFWRGTLSPSNGSNIWVKQTGFNFQCFTQCLGLLCSCLLSGTYGLDLLWSTNALCHHWHHVLPHLYALWRENYCDEGHLASRRGCAKI